MPETMPHAVATDTIRLNKLVRASRERVFEAWTNPDQLAVWFAPDADTTCNDVTIEPRVGGTFRFCMTSSNGKHTGGGKFTVFDPPNVLAYTWSWEEQPDFGADSLVTIELHEAENPYDEGQPATEVILTHERLKTAVERSEHTGGWWGALRGLGFYVRGVDPKTAMSGASSVAG
ncbi:MAG: SRPBCC domain-containing protein [Planctomycetota bacterium]